MSDEQLEKNKEVVINWFAATFDHPENMNLDAIDDLVDENCISHNPMAGQGRAGVRNYLVNTVPSLLNLYSVLNPTMATDLQSSKVTLIADGDLVVRQQVFPAGMLIDIYRIQKRKIVEHWDAFRPSPGYERLPGF